MKENIQMVTSLISEIDIDNYEVSKQSIRANWLLSFSKRELNALLKQAFIYLIAEKDYLISIKSDFPESIQIQLKEKMSEIQSEEFKEKIKKEHKDIQKSILDISSFRKNVIYNKVHLLQTKFSDKIEKDFKPMFFTQDGIFFVDFSKNKNQNSSSTTQNQSSDEIYQDIKFEFKLKRIEIQKAPTDHIKDRALFKGKLGWYKVYDNG